ncbi:MAG: hypothetical protein NVS4B7_11890 [Ktedonobacteraceae bacterium]
MNIFGLDFTSAPGSRKPITCAVCELQDNRLHLHTSQTMPSLADFEAFLHLSGPWIAALDFPFGQPAKLLSNLNWPTTWSDYIQYIAAMGKPAFEETLSNYQKQRPRGDKQHQRITDKYAGACSPMMLHRVPVGKMFFQGAPRLLAAGVSVLPCHPLSDDRIVIEGYPALVARKWLGKRSYKSDERNKQTAEKEYARQAIVNGLRSPTLTLYYGLTLEISDAVADILISDPMGDSLDALLCAVQAAWAYTQRNNGYGIPSRCDRDEGWIVDPSVCVIE